MGTVEIGGEGDIGFLILEFPGMSVAMADMDANGQAARGANLAVELGGAGGKVFRIEIREMK